MNIVIGKRSNLSEHLKKSIDDVFLVSTKNAIVEIKELDIAGSKSVNIIFNNFQTAVELNDLSDPESYIKRSIMVTAEVLGHIKDQNWSIKKILYTSSSSVYGNNILCSEKDGLRPLNLHSSLKIANEKLISKFCEDHGIDYTIARVFNMYGGNDRFSIISKIERAVRDKSVLIIVNNGNAVRDFIHIDDVVRIYAQLLNKRNVPILNIGTGEGISIKNMLDYLTGRNIRLKIKNVHKDELKISTADTTKLFDEFGEIKFKNVEDFLFERLS